MPALPRGTYTPLITPFTARGRVDTRALEALIERQLEAGVEALVMLGTTGESPALTAAEARAVVRAARRRAPAGVALVVGVGSNDTTASVREALTAVDQGADGLLALTPYYNRPEQDGIRRHFEAIADAAEAPLLVYNIPGRTAVNVHTATLAALAEHPNIVGVKEASNDVDQVGEVIRATPDDFLVLSGCDNLNFPLLALGGDGVISAMANLVPEAIKSLVDHALAGRLGEARVAHHRLMPLTTACYLEVNPIPVKTALALTGYVQERFRLPLGPMAAANRERLAQVLGEYGLLDPAETEAA